MFGLIEIHQNDRRLTPVVNLRYTYLRTDPRSRGCKSAGWKTAGWGDLRTNTERIRLTRKAIETLECPKTGRRTIYDAVTRYLGLRIDSNGTKSFFWFRKVRTIPTFKAIGKFPATSIEKARETVAEWDGQLAEWKRHEYEGANPFEKPKDELTFNELVEAYISRHVQAHAKRPAHAEKRVRQQVEFYLRDWKSRKLSVIQRKDVLELHDTLGKKHKVAANRTAQLIRLLFNFAISTELWKGLNPAQRIKRFPEHPRKRFLNHEELPRLFTALSSEPSADLRDFVVLALFTGCRKSDIFSARWDNISFDDRRWMIPDPKRESVYRAHYYRVRRNFEGTADA